MFWTWWLHPMFTASKHVFLREVSSGQICLWFYGHLCLLILLRFCLYKKRTLFFFFYRTLDTPPSPKIFILKKGKHFNCAGTEPNTHMLPIIDLSNIQGCETSKIRKSRKPMNLPFDYMAEYEILERNARKWKITVRYYNAVFQWQTYNTQIFDDFNNFR